MKNHYQIIVELYNDFRPAIKGIISDEEIKKVLEIADLKNLSKFEISNLKDFLSYYFTEQKNGFRRNADAEFRKGNYGGYLIFSEEALSVSDRLSAISTAFESYINN